MLSLDLSYLFLVRAYTWVDYDYNSAIVIFIPEPSAYRDIVSIVLFLRKTAVPSTSFSPIIAHLKTMEILSLSPGNV